MHASSPHEYSPLIRKLESIFTLAEDEREALLTLPMQVAVLKEDQDIVREGDRPSRCCLILSGLACAYKVTGDGRRQIVSFTVPGDIPDLQSLHLKVLDTSISTLTPGRVGFIRHEALHDLCRRHHRLASAFWRETLIDAAVFREWMVNVGRRETYHRMAHLLCELLVRMHAVGLAEDHVCELPITQAEFGDALGVSTVHVNRVLQELRSDGLVELKDQQLRIFDWERLKEAGDFDPTYLHLQRGGGRMSLSLHPVHVATGWDEEGVLVFDRAQRLLAVRTHLSERNEVAPGRWYLEAGFGPADGIDWPTFRSRGSPGLAQPAPRPSESITSASLEEAVPVFARRDGRIRAASGWDWRDGAA